MNRRKEHVSYQDGDRIMPVANWRSVESASITSLTCQGFVGQVPITFWIWLPMLHQGLAHLLSTVLLGYFSQNCSGPRCSSGHTSESTGSAAVFTLICFSILMLSSGCLRMPLKNSQHKVSKETLLEQN